ncbi:MAG TPA: septum formation initiator family protein, partial [Arthrobacter sp.]
MATRRPKVPKAASRQQATTDPAKEAAGVIRADFGGPTGSAKGSAPGKAAPAKDTGTPKARGTGPTAVAAGKTPKAGITHDDAQPVPAKAFSGRMLALAVVVIAITIMLAPTVKIFFDKRAELAALSADIAARQATQDGLRQQISRWQDPNYVKQQARDRINMVMPGES